jgi:peptidoglycan hydrolase-like protein with peptidoglycan-binding domain
MRCERTRRPTLLLALLAALVVALALPATGQAADRGKPERAGVLAPGAGYGTDGGSQDVRALQRRLRALGTTPGPIDGLYGPLTRSAVERFQQRHGLAADGIVGRQTRRQLNAAGGQANASPAHRETPPGNLERKSPAPQAGAESAETPARPAPADAPSRAAPKTTAVPSRAAPDTTEGVSPQIVALLAALAAVMLLAGLWRRREASVNFGLVCAALLGTFGIGAAVGALFASEAAPDGVDQATAQTGVLLAPSVKTAKTETAKTAKADRVRSERTAPKRVVRAKPRPPQAAKQTSSTSTSTSTPAAAPRPAPLAAAPPAPPPPTVAAPVATRIRVPTYVVKPGDSLSNIARTELGAGSSSDQLAAAVEKLAQLNVPGRIQSGDPNILEAGEELMLP